MSTISGYAGNILKVNFSSQNVNHIPTQHYGTRFIGGRGIATMLKVFQMSPDGLDVIIPEFDIKNNNHAILTFTQCPMLFYFERHKDDRINKEVWLGGQKAIRLGS